MTMFMLEVRLLGRDGLGWEKYSELTTNLAHLQQFKIVLEGNSNVIGIRIKSWECNEPKIIAVFNRPDSSYALAK